jgi:serine/threonine protein kinase/Flp pilus assembly protein TadD
MNTAQMHDESSDDSESDSGVTAGSGVHAVQRLKPGDTFGNKYRVRGTLGAGGFAVVYEAEHLGLGRLVAIKVMHLEPETPAALVRRFRQEARISAVVHHPNVLEVYDTGTLEDGSPYLVMERIDGETLYRRMARRGLTIPAVVEVGRQLLNALSVIAERGVVHRDIKPENIMLHAAGDGSFLVKVLDFGISKHASNTDLKLTRSGALIGTPHYMSPEQIRGEAVDIRSDLYAVGVVLYEALTGKVPYDGPSLNALVLAALNSDAPLVCDARPDCPRELERIIFKAMSRSREQRYANSADMQRDLAALAENTKMPNGADVWRTLEWVAPADALKRKPSELEKEDTRIVKPVRTSERRSRPRRRAQMASLSALLALGALAPRGVHQAARTLANEPERAVKAALQAALPTRDAARRIEVTRLVHAPVVQPAVAHAAELSQVVSREPKTGGEARRTKKASHADSHTRARAERPKPAPVPAGMEQLALRDTRGDHLSREQAAPQTKLGVVRDALAAYVLGDLERAHELYRRAVKDAPSAPEAWRGLGIVAARRGHYAEARRALHRYLQLSPEAPDAEAVQARSNALP